MNRSILAGFFPHAFFNDTHNNGIFHPLLAPYFTYKCFFWGLRLVFSNYHVWNWLIKSTELGLFIQPCYLLMDEIFSANYVYISKINKIVTSFSLSNVHSLQSNQWSWDGWELGGGILSCHVLFHMVLLVDLKWNTNNLERKPGHYETCNTWDVGMRFWINIDIHIKKDRYWFIKFTKTCWGHDWMKLVLTMLQML